jgi:predicted transglutaminase-like cysteine proteinase
MFARVVACGLAAWLVAAPAPFRNQDGALAGVDDSAVRSKLAPQVPKPLAIAAQSATEPFGLQTLPWFSGDIVQKWNGVEAEIHAEAEILAHCRDAVQDCPPAAQKLLAIVAAGRAESGLARIGVINRAINLAIRPTSDLQQWGVVERWSAPLVTLTTGRGDCEDYAIAKFVALRLAGIAPEDVKLVAVRDREANDEHAVVAVDVDGRWIVLDNRWLALLTDSELRRMLPRFVMDESGVRAYVRTPPRDAAPAVAALGFPSAD